MLAREQSPCREHPVVCRSQITDEDIEVHSRPRHALTFAGNRDALKRESLAVRRRLEGDPSGIPLHRPSSNEPGPELRELPGVRAVKHDLPDRANRLACARRHWPIMPGPTRPEGNLPVASMTSSRVCGRIRVELPSMQRAAGASGSRARKEDHVSENAARLAVLIDADNAQAAIIDGLLAEVAKYGTAHVKRAYGDWTGTSLKGWKDQLLAQSIQPIQQFAYTSGKNSTDSAMVIDAMDLLYSGRFDGFCLVSSDSDFTRLASRLRESGLTVYGFGERKTPKPFVAACDKFIYIENLRRDGAADGSADQVPAAARRASAAELKRNTPLVSQLRYAVEAASDDDGWAQLGQVGMLITKQQPDFDSRSYGYAKLSDLMAATTLFELERRRLDDGKQSVIYIRDKRRRQPGKTRQELA
jgi:uncharacterized LabA/DUF88 family protein